MLSDADNEFTLVGIRSCLCSKICKKHDDDYVQGQPRWHQDAHFSLSALEYPKTCFTSADVSSCLSGCCRTLASLAVAA
jgi:hypothetical protein